MSTGDNMILRRKANEFRVWRAGQSVGQKGWKLADGHHYGSVREKREVDYYFEE
jgi:hypothetical protein